jgi:tetratricopeptide (TPR) repeat protein
MEVDLSRATISTQSTAQPALRPILTRGAPQIFHGRNKFVGDIVQTLLHSDQARVPILGPGGMGKTSVALAVANDPAITKRFGDRRHFIPCEEVTNPAPLVELIALHLGISLPSSSPFQHLLESLRSHHSPCLLILDNFETPWGSHETRTQIEQIVSDISCIQLLSLIVTMRGRVPPAGVKWSYPSSALDPLSLDAARETFLDIWSSEDLKLDDLLQALDFVPLAVTLVAPVGQSSQFSPSELLESWNKEQTRLLDLGPTDRLKSIDYSISLSLQSTAMTKTPDALQLLSIVAMLPGGAVLRTLPSLAPSIANLDRAIRTLLSVSLAYKDPSGTLRLLSPIRSYVSQHHAPDSISLESLRKFYFNLADQCECNPGDEDFLRIRDDVAPEESNMESVLSYCLTELSNEHAVLAVENYACYLHWNHPRSELLEAAVHVSRQRGFTELLPLGLYRLGNMLISQSEYTRASTKLEEAQMLFRLDGNRSQAASCLHRLSEVLRMQSRYNEARTKLEEARDEFQAIGDHSGAAQRLLALGQILCIQERYGDARTVLEDAQERFQELDEPLGAARCLRSIGQIQCNEGQYNDAHNILEDAQKKFQAIGATLGATQCLQGLGEILLERGQYDEARISFEKAQHQYQEIGERIGAAQCLENLGDILLHESCYNDALSALEEALSQYRAIGDRLGIAGSLMSIGETFLPLGPHAEARRALEDACSIYREIGRLGNAKYCDDLLSSIRASE